MILFIRKKQGFALYTGNIFCGGNSYKRKFRDQDVDYVGFYTSRIDLILYLYSTINVPFLGLSHIFFYFSFYSFFIYYGNMTIFLTNVAKKTLNIYFSFKEFYMAIFDYVSSNGGKSQESKIWRQFLSQ